MTKNITLVILSKIENFTIIGNVALIIEPKTLES